MKGVAGVAVAGEFAVDPRAPLQGMGQGFEDHHAAALADDEPVAVAVEGAARLLGFVVALRDGPHGVESGDAQRGHRRFDAAGDHDVGVPTGDDPEGVPDGAGARGAGRDGAADRPLGAETDGDMARGEIGQRRRDGERGHLPGAAQEDRLLFPLDGGQSPDGGADDHARPLRFARTDDQAGVGQGHLGGGQGIDDEIIHAPEFFSVHVRSGSNPFSSPAIFVSKAAQSNLVIRAMPDFPAQIPSQVSATELPSGVTAPMPVITTLLFN